METFFIFCYTIQTLPANVLNKGGIFYGKFQGGCSGNTQGVAHLIEGMDAKEAVKRLEGIRCGFRPTSCPDQLAKALKGAMGE